MTERVRRNGLLSSCEPYRKSKLRCDHNRPICGRCARRRLSQHQCHYHPAPMVKRAAPQQGSSCTATTLRTSTEDNQPYEPINMNVDLMCFADPETHHLQRTNTSLTRTGVTLPRPFQPDQQVVSEGAILLRDILDLVIEIGGPLQTFSICETDLCIHSPLIKLVWTATNNSIRGLSDDLSKL